MCMIVASSFYSSFLFLGNYSICILFKKYTYAFLFYALTCSSLLFRLYSSHITKAVDKVCIFLVVIYGGYTFLQKLYLAYYNRPTAITYILYMVIFGTFLHLCTNKPPTCGRVISAEGAPLCAF